MDTLTVKMKTINRADLWVTKKYEKDEDNEVQVVKVEVTNNATITLNNCALNVEGKLINSDTIILGQEGELHIFGDIKIWPEGYFTNNGNVDDRNGRIYKVDDLKTIDTGINIIPATIDGTHELDVFDTAIVHDFAGLKKAAVTDKAIYELIYVMKYEEINESDITMEENLDIDADMYIEWGCGIEVPEDCTLNFVGSNHNIENFGDIWVYGNLNLGSGSELYNYSKIQVGGIYGDLPDKCTFTNNGTIENLNYIEVLSNGLFTDEGTINNQGTFKVQDGEYNGNGELYTDIFSDIQGVSGKVYMKVYSYDQLMAAIDDASITGILVAGNIGLDADLTLNKTILIGSNIYGVGELGTNGFTLTIPDGYTLNVNEGYLVINGNGHVVNNGTITVADNGGIRIEEDGMLETATDIDIRGNLRVYDYENIDSQITGTGKITTYSDRAGFIDHTLDILYEFDEQEMSIDPSAISVSAGASIVSTVDIELKASDVRAWFLGDDRNDDYARRHYAYAAMMLNEIINVSDIADLDSSDNYPYTKVTYGYAKNVFQQIVNKLGLEDETTIEGFMEELNSKDKDAYIDNFGELSSLNELFDDFWTALNDVI